MKICLIFAWYDFWVGAYYDRAKSWLYVFPVPMFGIILKFRDRPVLGNDCEDETPW